MKTRATVHDKPAQERGFSLICTVLLLMLIALVGLGLLSLSTISLRGSQTAQAHQEAQANARLAMVIAIGELQKYAGADQRVTARSDIFSPFKSLGPNGRAIFSDEAVKQAGVTIVSRTEGNEIRPNPAISDTLDSPKERPGRLSGLNRDALPAVLMSGNDRFDLNWVSLDGQPPSPLTAYPEGYITSTTQLEATEQVTLLEGREDTRNPQPEVHGKWVKTPGGRYGWAVVDEGTKARLDHGVPGKQDTTLCNVALLSQRNATEWLVDKWNNKTWPAQGLSLVPSIATVPLAAQTPEESPANWQADATIDSRSILADVRNGGLKQDLTAALAPVAPAGAEFADGLNGRLFDFYKPGTGIQNGSDVSRPFWTGLRSWFRIPNSGVISGNSMTIDTSTDNGIHPVLSRAQMAIHGAYYYAAPGSPTVEVRLYFVPAVVLWNPYDVDLVSPKGYAFEMQSRNSTMFWWLYRFNFSYQIEGKPWVNKVFGDEQSQTTSQGIQFPLRIDGPVTIPAGKAMIFTPDDLTPWQGNSGVHLLKKGWHPGKGFYKTVGTIPAPATGSLPRMRIKMDQAEQTMVWNFYDRHPTTGANIPSQSWHRLLGIFANNSNPNYFTPPLVTPANAAEPINSVSADFPSLFWCHGMRYALSGMPTQGQRSDQRTNSVRWISDHNVRARVIAGMGGASRTGVDEGWAQMPSIQGSFYPYDMGEAMYDIGVAGGNDYEYAYVGENTDSGSDKMVLFTLPRKGSAPQDANAAISGIAQLGNAPIMAGGGDSGNLRYSHGTCNPQATFPIGNSRANYRIPADQVAYVSGVESNSEQPTWVYDTSYLLNDALYDRYFFSTIPQSGALDVANPLYNRRLVWNKKVANPTDARLPGQAASYLMMNGGFNVNSTSVRAWELFLGGLVGTEIEGAPNKDLVPFSRLNTPGAGGAQSSWKAGTPDAGVYNGYPLMDRTKIRALAESMVAEVKLRGPFPSLAAFVNRARSDNDLFKNMPAAVKARMQSMGAVQAAIETSGINQDLAAPPSGYDSTLVKPEQYSAVYKNRPALARDPSASPAVPGSSLQDAPGVIGQAHLMEKLDQAMTARSDTFRIVSCGESKDGKIRAYCETVVQRMPDYIDANDEATTPRYTWKGNYESGYTRLNSLKSLNDQFGRRFQIISFRWIPRPS